MNDDPCCSTAICPLPATPARLIDLWEHLCGELAAGIVPDGRLNGPFQQEVLELARVRGQACPLIVHPVVGAHGQPAASPCSPDRDERRAAREQLLASAERAGRFGVPRLLLLPQSLPLSLSRRALVERLERGVPPAETVDGLEEERRERSTYALDALCLVLDSTLRGLEPIGVELLLSRPAPWPDQAPGAGEVTRLLQLFAGAPLGTGFATDWWYLGRTLGAPGRLGPDHTATTPEDGPLDGEPLSVADGCGLSGALPAGTGELPWSELRPPKRPGPVVLTADAALGVSAEEMVRAAALLRSW